MRRADAARPGVRDGRIVDAVPGESWDEVIDASGCIVMAGGIDLHTHIGGGKVNLARLLMAEDHRDAANPYALPTNPLELPSCGRCAPGTLATGYRYVEMGYTAAFEPAMVASNARQAHMEMGDVPMLDHGAYVMLGNDELFLQLLAEGGADARNFAQLRDYTGWTMHASKAMGVKVVNPGGISAFKFNQRKLDVDERARALAGDAAPGGAHAGARAARAWRAASAAHPRQQPGRGGQHRVDAADHRCAGGLAGAPDARAVPLLRHRGAEEVLVGRAAARRGGERQPERSASTSARSCSARPSPPRATRCASMRKLGLANPRKWVGADIECDAGCGVVPFRYREQSYVNALQWAIGLEIFLLVKNPWRVVLTTDHPNGGPFTSYPHLIRLLMDRTFRDEQLAQLHPDVAANCALRSIARELTLDEIAIMTRAAPATAARPARPRPPRRGRGGRHRGLPRGSRTAKRCSRRRTYVFKDGALVARAGRITATPVGGTHFVEPGYDRGDREDAAPPSGARTARSASIACAIGHDELCRCCNGGRLLPAACFEAGA